MVASLALAGLALRDGYVLRRKRLRGEVGRAPLRRRHLRLAKPAVGMLVVGALAGPASALWLRDWTPMTTLHGWLGALAASLFVATALLGRRLEQGLGRPVEAHARLALAACLCAALAVFAGFVLLP